MLRQRKTVDGNVGIACPKCDCPDVRVYRTTPAWRGKIRRERLCQNPKCGHKFITTEQARADEVKS